LPCRDAALTSSAAQARRRPPPLPPCRRLRLLCLPAGRWGRRLSAPGVHATGCPQRRLSGALLFRLLRFSV